MGPLQLGVARGESTLEPGRHRQIRDEARVHVAGWNRRGGELHECQRVALCLGQDPATQSHAEVRRTSVEERGCLFVVEGPELEHRERERTQGRFVAVPHRDDERDTILAETTYDESKSLGSGLVEPLRVVDDGKHRSIVRGHRQQLQDCERDQVRIRSEPLAHAERGEQGVALPGWELARSMEQGSHQLVKSGEGQPGLRLDPGEREVLEAHVLHLRLEGLQDERLADPGRALDQKTAAPT